MIDLTKQKLLIIAPHPDDEVIGCGGLIQRVKEEGGKVYVLFLTVGDTKDFSKKGISKTSERTYEIGKVAKFLQYDNYQIAFQGNNNHLRLDVLGQKALMDMIERESIISLEKIKPTIVVFPSSISYNQDHRIAAFAVHAALRTSSKDKHFVKTALSYENPADFWTLGEKRPASMFVPLTSEEFDRKIEALKLYSSQWRDFPSSRSEKALEALATLRGSQCNSEFAEAFIAYRISL